MPGWTVFHALISTKVYGPTSIGYYQVIAAPPSDLNTVYTVLKRAYSMFQRLGQSEVILTWDEALYSKAQIIKWRNPIEFKNVFNRLGGFHCATNFMGITGTVMKDGGLEYILIESNIYGGAVVAKILEGKSYNRGIRAHKIVYESMWWLKLQAFGDLMASGKTIKDEECNRIMDALQECLLHFNQSTKQRQQNVKSLQASLTNAQQSLELLSPYLQMFDEFVTARSETAAFWNLEFEILILCIPF